MAHCDAEEASRCAGQLNSLHRITASAVHEIIEADNVLDLDLVLAHALAPQSRGFDKDFGRVYDSLVLAVSSLELKINNMERTSGYISASGITLPPSEAKTMYRQAVDEWCQQNGFNSSVLDQKYRTKEIGNAGEMLDLSSMAGKYEKMQKTLTFQLVKMGDNQTKVKLRFSDVYYPGEVETYYKLVWQAVDKQIFVDQNIEGGVEKR